jgi:hypothetical protein
MLSLVLASSGILGFVFYVVVVMVRLLASITDGTSASLNITRPDTCTLSCECGNEPSGSIKCGELLDLPRKHWRLKKVSVPWL